MQKALQKKVDRGKVKLPQVKKSGNFRLMNEVKVLEQEPTLQLSVRFRELLAPLLFPIRRGSHDFDSDDDDDGFPGRKGWVLILFIFCFVRQY